MATLRELQKQLDDKSLDPSKLSRKQRLILDELIKRGDLKGPSMREVQAERGKAAQSIAREKSFYADPIAAALDAEDNPYFIKGRSTAELAGDVSASIAPYAAMRKKIYGAAQSGNLWQKGPGKFLQSATKVADRLPGRFKLIGGALKLIARAADTPGKVLKSPLGRAEIYSVLGGSAGAGAGSITYDMLNEAAGVQIANSITDAFADLPEKEIDQNIVANALRATKTAAYWNAGAAALTPFVFGPLGKLATKLFGAKGPKAQELAEFARDKGLPLPLMTGIEDGVLTPLAANYFKTVGVFPFVSGIGREALETAEQAAGKQYLNGLTSYAPLMKTAALSSSIYNQAAKTFADNAALIGSKYQAFDTLAETIGNPKVIPTTKLREVSSQFLQRYKQSFPDLDAYAAEQAGARIQDIEKILQNTGDPLYLFMAATKAMGGEALITPKQYKGLMQMLNRAIEGTGFNLPTGSVWALREAMETDLNSFGANLTKNNFLNDKTIKETYDNMVSGQGKEFADNFLQKNVDDSVKLYDKLKDANATFSSVMGFYTKAALPRSLKKFDSSLFTQQGVNGVFGREGLPRDKIFETMERDVFASNSPEAIEQFKVILGAAGPKATQNGKALFEAAKARYFFNAFLDSFDSAGSPQARSVFRDVIDASPMVKAGTEYAQDAMARLGTEDMLVKRGFSIDDVRLNNGIFDVKDIRFSPKDFADFKINKFMNKLGIGAATGDLGRQKMAKLLGEDGASEFYKFTNYMKAISDIPISDTSTFLQRRFTLSGGRGLIGGAIIGGGLFAANPFAPAIFLYLARKAGRILSDPTALRYMNDALLPEELVKGLKGKKIGFDNKFKIRSVNSKLTAAGLTQKREAFARFANYVTDEEEDLPKVNPKTVSPAAIQERLLNQAYSIPQPRYDENTLPPETIESMYAQQFMKGSGDTDKDNQMVEYVRATQRAEAESEVDDELRDQEADQAAEPLELENVVAAVQEPNNQLQASKFQDLFPQDSLGQAIVRGRQRGQG